MQRLWCLAVVAILAQQALLAEQALAWPTVFPTGTTLYDPERVYSGYVLFAPMGEGSEDLRLINMAGDVVHQWKLPYKALRARLLPSGHLLVVAYNPREEAGRPGVAPFWMGGPAGVLAELTWEGKEVFRRIDLNAHHDALVLPSGNYLYLAWERIPLELQAKIRGGIEDSEFRDMPREAIDTAKPEDWDAAEKVMFNDVLIEVTPRNKIVWTWHANEHLDPDVDIMGPIYTRQEWCHANAINVLANGNILLTSRTLDSMLIIDKETGKITFRWGNMAQLGKDGGPLRLKTSVDTLAGPHDAREIPPGLPGAGHLTCYDNGVIERGLLLASRAVEVDPSTGALVWQSAKVVDKTFWDFGRRQHSHLMGSAQRLPGGNTLLCEGINGRFVQVTDKLDVVWEYISPFVYDQRYNGSVFKIDCYAQDYCPQFRSLSPAKGQAIKPVSTTAGRQKADPPKAADTHEAKVKAANKKPAPWSPGIGTALAAAAAAIVLAMSAYVAGGRVAQRRAAKSLPKQNPRPRKA